MDIGLQKLLDAIKRAPSSKLVERFLALIADYKDDEKKAKAALELAKSLVQTDSGEAMRIAHMVYKWDRENIQALDIVIEGLKARGRHGKAEVLAIERNKLVKHMEYTGASNPGEFANIDVSQVMELEGLEGISPQPNPKRTEVSQQVSAQKTTVNDRREEERLPQGVVAQSIAPEGDERRKQPQRARESMPIHLDIMGDVKPAATQKLDDLFAPATDERQQNAEDAVDLLFHDPATAVKHKAPPAEAKTVKLPKQAQPQFARDQATRMTHSGGTARQPSLSLDPSVVKPIPQGPGPEVHANELGVAVEMFDYYWQQGFVEQARSLLEQTSSVAGAEPWWRARNELLAKSRPSAPPAAEEAAPTKPDFWGELNKELGQLARRIDINKLAAPVTDEPPAPLPSEAWEALLRVLRRREGETPEETLSRQWDVVSGLWGEGPHPDCADLLLTLELHRATPGFWGMYLDSLLVGRQARAGLQEIRNFIPERPRLIWCKTAYDRLELIWKSMHLRRFAWCEDDGVWPLLKYLAERPHPTLRGTVLMGKDHER